MSRVSSIQPRQVVPVPVVNESAPFDPNEESDNDETTRKQLDVLY